MKLLVISLLILSFLNNISFADENLNKIKKIDQQLETLKSLYESGVLEQNEYENSTAKLLTKKASLLLEPKKKNENTKERSTELDKQLEVIDKLYKDGVLSENDYNKTKKLLIKKSKEKKISDAETFVAEPGTFVVNIKETHGKSYEKAELLYKGYVVSTYRPGGIKVTSPSGKTLVRITDNLKVKYFNNGESKITIKKNVLDIKLGIKGTEDGLKKTLELLKSGKREEKKKFDKDAHKLELFIEGKKVLHYEGRYVPKHKAFFYQVLTADFQSFHFYIRIAGKPAIALQMEGFNRKIDNAVRKAKEKLSVEYDITMEQIDDIINDRIDEEAGKAVEDGIEDAISQSVSEAIQQSVGEAMSAGLVEAIEQATGEAIDDALEQELANAIDEEIARAVEMGIEEAAVTAGWQAYFDTLARGGTEAEANANAYEACGAACENY